MNVPSTMPLHFSGINRSPYYTGAEKDFLPNVKPRETFAVLDHGSNGIKGYIVYPDGMIEKIREEIRNGDSIAAKGGIYGEAASILTRAYKTIREQLDAAKVKKINIFARATAGLRSADNGMEKLKEAHSLGLPFQIIDGKEEGRRVYRSVLQGENIAPDEKILVLEIGGGSTELVFGTGPRDVDDRLTQILEVGSTRLALDEDRLYDIDHINQKRREVWKMLDNAFGDGELNGIVRGRRLFIKASNLDDLARVHYDRTLQDMTRMRITPEIVDFYLSEKGIAIIEDTLKDPLPKRDEVKLLSKLIIARELMDYFNLPGMELGYKGGLKFDLLEEQMLNVQQEQSANPAGLKAVMA